MSRNKDKTNPEFCQPTENNSQQIDLFSYRIPAGFPSPAEDFLEKRLDLNDYLIKNKAATFLVKVTGNSMEKAGILDGDVLVIDRSAEPSNGKVILGVLNGEFTVKRIRTKRNKLFLEPANDDYKPIEITPEMDFKVWGVATFAIHTL
ncbi:MAG: translesion error-prone DNA polymerase V autoproteolytic subunit [Bacteroidales bacterium]|nr:translesion error-prone DNA polymerase V autoproteolytic subunit [Bacteroidales bacterium]